MAYDAELADRVRTYLEAHTKLPITEKEMFSGLAFLVDDKMCVNISGENLMCRFDPALEDTIAEQRGFQPMIMKGKALKGYCYVMPDGFRNKKDFEWWLQQCLAYNPIAKPSRKKGAGRDRLKS